MKISECFNDWLKVIDINKLNEALYKIHKLSKTQNITPNSDKVFKCFQQTSLRNTKIIMLGMDPYPQEGLATGLAFGVEGNKIPPSLRVLEEACINYEMPHGTIEFDYTLKSWANQGILLLNSALTCEVGKPGSHASIWRPFISDFLIKLSNNHTGCLYVLMGQNAQSFEPYINVNFNNVIKTKHPAYYARIGKRMPYETFTYINKFSCGNYGETINWYKEIK